MLKEGDHVQPAEQFGALPSGNPLREWTGIVQAIRNDGEYAQVGVEGLPGHLHLAVSSLQLVPPPPPTAGEVPRCPSRDQNVMADRAYPGPDYWEFRPDGTRTCSFCGSLHEEDYLDILQHYAAGEPGYRFSTTTKSYKRYGNRPGATNAGQGGIKFYTWHMSPENYERANQLEGEARKRLAAEQ